MSATSRPHDCASGGLLREGVQTPPEASTFDVDAVWETNMKSAEER